MSDEPSIQDLLDAQAHFRLPGVALVEKDWHVVRAMSAIGALDAGPFRLVFAGGTCLARAHRLVSRMSEDVDFKIVAPEPLPVGRSKRRGQLGDLRKRVAAGLLGAGFGIEPDDVRSRDDNHYSLYNLHYAGSGGAVEPLRATIQVEMSYATLHHDAITLPVSSFVAEAFGRAPEIRAINCVSVTETAAEKLVSLMRRTAMELRGLGRKPDPNLVRHIYDLHVIRTHIDRAAVVALARAVAATDGIEFRIQYPDYVVDAGGETRKALAFLLADPGVRRRYESFVANMVYGEPVAFGAAMRTITSMVDDTWPAP